MKRLPRWLLRIVEYLRDHFLSAAAASFALSMLLSVPLTLVDIFTVGLSFDLLEDLTRWFFFIFILVSILSIPLTLFLFFWFSRRSIQPSIKSYMFVSGVYASIAMLVLYLTDPRPSTAWLLDSIPILLLMFVVGSVGGYFFGKLRWKS